MSEIENLAKKLASLDLNDQMGLIKAVLLQGIILGLIKAKESKNE